MNPESAHQELTSETATLLDVRQPDEREFASIQPSLWIPMGEIPSRLEELNNLKDSRLIVYCHHGMRSAQVVGFLQSHGFSDVHNLEGGIDLWSHNVDNQVPRY